MRETKFRVFDRKEKKMVYPKSILLDYEFGFRVSVDSEAWFENDTFVLLQDTGLHDRHGKEIYEGDVLEYPKSPRLQFVKWDTERGRWLDVEDHNRCSIIGNIYENESLLKTNL